MDADPLTVTKAQVKAALAALGLVDTSTRPDRADFVRLEIANGRVVIERFRRDEFGRVALGVGGPGTETTVIPIERARPTSGAITPEEAGCT